MLLGKEEINLFIYRGEKAGDWGIFGLGHFSLKICDFALYKQRREGFYGPLFRNSHAKNQKVYC